MRKHNLLAPVLVAAAALHGAAVRAEAETTAAKAGRPNVILIVADDLGYADLGVQGAKDIRTPNIDTLARSGVRFTQGYVSAPLCSPSRAGMLTGRYQQRFGHEHNPGPDAAATFGLPKGQVTVANRFKDAGYATGMVGKWHLGNKENLRPPARGFDEFFGFLGGAHSYRPKNQGTGTNVLRRGNEPVTTTKYLTNEFSDEAVAFIERHKDGPFFLYVPFNAIHSPMEAAPGKEKEFEGIKNEKRRTMATMLSALDDGVGRIMETVRSHGLEERTLVFFIADNGGPTGGNGSRNDPLSGFKGGMLEGGIRVPFLVSWKGSLPEGKVYEEPVISLDIVPTALAAAGVKAGKDAKLDGVNLLPYLKGDKQGRPHESLFWRMGQQHAARVGDWKLVKMRGGQEKLVNLAEDIAEKHDLSAKHPKKLKELRAAYAEWNEKNIEPRWQDSRKADDGASKTKRKARRAAKR